MIIHVPAGQATKQIKMCHFYEGPKKKQKQSIDSDSQV